MFDDVNFGLILLSLKCIIGIGTYKNDLYFLIERNTVVNCCDVSIYYTNGLIYLIIIVYNDFIRSLT